MGGAIPLQKKNSKDRGRETCAREVKDPTLGNLILNCVKLGRPGFFLFRLIEYGL